MSGTGTRELPRSADVVVVGAGPGGSAAASHLARAGLSVVLLEKTGFPRDKVCGDALTPRAVHELGRLGIDPEAAARTPDWHKNTGLRLIGGGQRLEFAWPEVDGLPTFGLTRARTGLDEALARHAAASGADLHEHVMALEVLSDEHDWVRGVRACRTDRRGRKTGETFDIEASAVIAADGVSSRTATGRGIAKRDDRPMGVAVRSYYASPRSDDGFIESWIELADQTGTVMPGYGWLFPMGDGTLNVGLGMLDTSPQFGKVAYKQVLESWLTAMGDEWGIDAQAPLVPVKSAALPMAFNRTPHHEKGLFLVGDAGGMVNPFNGEGIDYALQSGRTVAEVVAESIRYPLHARRDTWDQYTRIMGDSLGSYFTLGRIFAEVIGRPELMKLGIKYGMRSDVVMRFVVKLLANLYRDGSMNERDGYDRVIAALESLVPATSNDSRV